MKNKIKTFFLNAWNYIKEAKIELIVLFGSLILDLVTKAVIESALSLGESVTLIPKFLHFKYIHNDGAAFGSKFGLDKLLGKTGTMIFFIVLSAVAVCFFAYFLYKGRGKHIVNRLALALVIGGALGNLVDRIAFGYVRDFVQIEYFGFTLFGSTTFAIFNVADVALVVGVILFVVYYIFIFKEPKQNEDENVDVKAEEVPDEAAAEKIVENTEASKEDKNENNA